MQCAEWSQFAVDYFTISLILSKFTKLQLLEITSKHCSEAACTLLLRVGGTITDVACNASTSEQRMVNTLTSRQVTHVACQAASPAVQLLATNVSNADRVSVLQKPCTVVYNILILWSTKY